jgi:hypothetical protein
MSFRDYVDAGWRICSIDKGRKAPVYAGWNVKPIAADAADGLDGAGLLHALSGTMALDIDDMALARPWLAERGVDIDALLEATDAVRIDSGRPGRAKLLYRMKTPRRSLRPAGSGLELRCATADGKSVQDVLPPSIHPDTKKPYMWRYADELVGDWRTLPPIPAGIAAIWRDLLHTTPVPATTAEPSVELEKLRKLIVKRDPDCSYEEWIKVGMALHHETAGAVEGLSLWDEWSSKAKGKYKGADDLRAHWMSFQSTSGKRVISGATLIAESSASADEFPDEPVTAPDAQPDEESNRAQMRKKAEETKKTALAKIEARLVYVFQDERYFDCERHKLMNSDNTIEHMFMHLMPRNKMGRTSPVKALKESSTKRMVDARGFHPGAGVIYQSGGAQYANLYRNTLPEPIAPMDDEIEKIEWLFNRIDDEVFRTWLLKFFGHVVQHPGRKIKSAPLIWSETQGNGKTTLLRMIPSLLVGSRYSREVTCALLNSDFNDYLLNAWHVNLTEFRAGTRGERTAISEKLKPWITDDTISIHPKGSAGYDMPNHFFVTATSNKDDAASVESEDRRWAIHEMHAPQFTEAEQDWIYNGFLLHARAPAVLRHYFLHLDLTGFSPSAKAPETEARRAMITASVSSDYELLQIAIEERSGIFSRDVVLTSEVREFIFKHSPARPSADRVGRILCRPPFDGMSRQFRCGKGMYRAVILRNHPHWCVAGGAEIMAHIQGEDSDVDILS